MKSLLIVTALSFFVMQALAQTPSDPISKGEKGIYTNTKNFVLKAADAVPEADYSYKPTEKVRSFGQVFAHIADGQYEFCSIALGDTGKQPDVEKTKTTKAEIVDALKTAFAYCDKAYDGMTDAHAGEMVKFFNRNLTKINVLSFNTAHTDEHYGNIVTYMRLKGLVPPSSKE